MEAIALQAQFVFPYDAGGFQSVQSRHTNIYLTEAPQRSGADGINDMKSALATMRYMQLRAESPKI